jgi:hypothetical protein
MPNFLLHPLTHEVYAIDDERVAHNFGHCVDVDFAEFERIASQGSLSAERLVAYASERHGTLHFSQVAFVELASEPGAPKRYAWASRIRATPVPNIPGVTGATSGATHMGSEFLWLWSPSAAMNAFVTHKERNRLSMASSVLFDAYEPSVGYVTATPGAQVGPDDVPGATLVPLSELTSEQRFFVSCIKPQRTHFQRRRANDRWTTDVQRADAMASERYKREEPAVRTLNRVRELTFWCGAPPSAKRALVSSVQADWFAQQTAGAYRGFALDQLPDDLASRIVCTTLAMAITEDTHTAAATCCALRSVSKAFCGIANTFLHNTIHRAHDRTVELVRHGKRESALVVGTHVRSLGLTTRVLLRMMHEVDQCPLAERKRSVAVMREYVKGRREHDQHACARAYKLVATTQIPSHVWSTLAPMMESATHARAERPHPLPMTRVDSFGKDCARALIEEVCV